MVTSLGCPAGPGLITGLASGSWRLGDPAQILARLLPLQLRRAVSSGKGSTTGERTVVLKLVAVASAQTERNLMDEFFLPLEKKVPA